MKKLTFSFILVVGLIFSFSVVSSAQSSHLSETALEIKQGDFRTKDQITAGIQQQLVVLYHELNQFPNDPGTQKTKKIETHLYKSMLSDLNSGRAVDAAYQDNMAVFMMDFPEEGPRFYQKKTAMENFYTIVFFN
ncbi:MAG: hypothetical protein WAT79_02075 [Saprospiraceae bacterium]